MKTKTVFALIILFAFLGIAKNSQAGTKIIDYGFEDWTGSEDTTSGYIFSSVYSTYWTDHTESNQVKNTSSDCGNRTAHSGTYYIHRQFNTSLTDSCLGGVAQSINDHGNIGLGGAYPSGSGDKTSLSTAITSNTLTFRAWFRVNGDWKTQSGMGLCKFFRLYGTGGADDYASSIVHFDSGNDTNTGFYIYDPGCSGCAYGTRYYAGSDLQDGNWHSMSVKVVRNYDDNRTGNITTSAWFDDWDMAGDPDGTRTITCSAFGSGFQYINMTQNWSATYPATLMGIDFDDIEVWDGLPDGETTAPAAPSGLSIN